VGSGTFTETIRWLARDPNATVQKWQGFEMNGFTWYTKQQDDKSTVQNSGVTLVALSGTDNTLDSYYGWIEEIWELDYMRFKIPLFSCKWIENRYRVKTDSEGFIIIDFNRLGYKMTRSY
jgi:hypothetical protein